MSSGQKAFSKHALVHSFPSVFMAAVLLVNLYQDDVIADLADAVPGNHVFAVPAEKTEAEAARTRDDQSCDTAVFAVEFHIYGTAKGPAGTDVDHFFLF